MLWRSSPRQDGFSTTTCLNKESFIITEILAFCSPEAATSADCMEANDPHPRRGVSWLRFRPDLVVTQRPHEHFLIYRLPGIIEHRRDAGRAADSRALPGNDDQRRGRFLIA